MDVGVPPAVPQRGQRVLDPADRAPAAQQRAFTAGLRGFEREPQGRTQLRLPLEVVSGERCHERVEPVREIGWSVETQQRVRLERWLGSQQQGALIGKVAVGGGAGDAGALRHVFHPRRRALGQQRTGAVNESLPGARLLLCPAGCLIWRGHRLHGTVVPWYWSPMTPPSRTATCMR